jgi:hypothetical protein
VLVNAAFELVVFALLLAVPFGIYYFRLRRGDTSGRDLAIDCAAAASLYLTALLFL